MKLEKLFAGIAEIDPSRRVIVARSGALNSPGDLEIERASLDGLAGRALYGADWRTPIGMITAVAFPARTAQLVDQESGERRANTSGAVEVTARIDDAAEWAKILEGIYTGLSLGERGAGLIDNPAEYGGADKLAKIACAKAAGRASARAAVAPLLAKMAEVSAMVAALEHPAAVNGVKFNLIMAGRSADLDDIRLRQRAAAELLAMAKGA